MGAVGLWIGLGPGSKLSLWYHYGLDWVEEIGPTDNSGLACQWSPDAVCMDNCGVRSREWINITAENLPAVRCMYRIVCTCLHICHHPMTWLISKLVCQSWRRLFPEPDYVTFGYLLSQIRLSIVCLSLTFVRPGPTQELKLSAIYFHRCVPWLLCDLREKITEIVPGEPLRRGR